MAYTGSQNIVDANFVPGFPNEELMARVSGPVVAQLEAVFLTDWFLETDQRLEIGQYALKYESGRRIDRGRSSPVARDIRPKTRAICLLR